MNKLPPPDVPGTSNAERFSNTVKMVLAVPPHAVTKEKKTTETGSGAKKKNESGQPELERLARHALNDGEGSFAPQAVAKRHGAITVSLAYYWPGRFGTQ